MSTDPAGVTPSKEDSSSPPRCQIMGIVNVTADSFSDGGAYLDSTAAIAHGFQLAADGADIVDVGGESTRPGALRVPLAAELATVVPVIRELAAAGLTVSVDTMRAQVAVAALEAGAVIINDVSGGLADSNMARVVADAGCQWVLMHWRGHSRDMQQRAVYQNVVAEVCAELTARVDAAVTAGVAVEKLIGDPGLGFAKNPEHDWALLASMSTLKSLGLPLLIGASRKSFLGRLLADADGQPRPTWGRETATAAVSLLAAQAGVWGVRVHDVRGTADVLAVHNAVKTASDGLEP